MKKLLIIILAAGILLLSGCAGESKTSDISGEPSPSSPKLSTQAQTTVQVSPEQESVENPFFFGAGLSQAKYHGIFLFNDMIEQEAILQINKIADLQDGTLYELRLDAAIDIPEERLALGYFYVQQDKILKTDATEENLDLLKSNELPGGSVIVCLDEEMKDPLSEGETGLHQYIEVNGDQREFHSYNDGVSTGYYESFTWEKGKGLVGYRSGYGAEKDAVELALSGD